MAVNTLTKTEGEGAGMAADLRYVEACAADIAKYSKSDKLLLRNQHFPFVRLKNKEILEENSNGIILKFFQTLSF